MWDDRVVEQIVAQNARLRERLDEAKRSLSWALQEIDDAASRFDANGIPAHDCEFDSNLEKGACDFHEHYVDARAALTNKEAPDAL